VWNATLRVPGDSRRYQSVGPSLTELYYRRQRDISESRDTPVDTRHSSSLVYLPQQQQQQW